MTPTASTPTPAAEPGRRGLLGRALRAALGPIFYWTDMYDRSHRPVHSKVLSTLVILVLLPTTVLLGRAIAAVPDRASPVVVAGFVAVVVIEVAASFGPRMMELYLRTRGGGSLDALAEAARAAANLGRVKTEPFDVGL
jgi:hypothetical protein